MSAMEISMKRHMFVFQQAPSSYFVRNEFFKEF